MTGAWYSGTRTTTAPAHFQLPFAVIQVYSNRYLNICFIRPCWREGNGKQSRANVTEEDDED